MNVPPVTALMPLKWHSERVPGKNMRPFCDRPLYHWVIRSLTLSKHVRQIVIDTDSEEIRYDAERHFDVIVLMRPKELWGDMVGITPLIDFQLSNVKGDHFLQTHSCNPLLSTATIDAAIEKWVSTSGADSLFAVTALQKRFYWPDGHPVNHDPMNMLRTQDLVPLMEENSNLYLFTRRSFETNQHRIGRSPVLFPMDPLEAIDIDTESDFRLAEAVARSGVRPLPRF